MNSSTNQNSENEQSPAKVSKVQEIGKMLLIRPSSNQNRQNRVINQKTNSPPNTEVSSSSDRPEVISGKIEIYNPNFFFEESINSSHHLFREFDWFELSSSLEICMGGQLLKNLWISDSQHSRQEQQQQQAIDRLQKQLNQQQSNKTFRAQEQEFQASSISNLLSNSFTLLKDLKAQSTDIPTNPPVIHG